uniref:Serine incorporator n=1 Tax=Eutreptiella gymnastica TaxID=73025 RepID=A0A7S4GJ73_9EUGL
MAGCCMQCFSGCDGKERDEESGGMDGGSVSICTKLLYTLYLMVGYVLCLCVKDGMHGLIEKFPFLASHACDSASIQDLCYGHSYVYRITFSLVMFYVLHMFMTCDCGVDSSVMRSLQTRHFGIKTLFLIFIFIVSIFMSTEFFGWYAKIALGASGLFIVMQIIILLDFAYEWNDAWVEKEEPKYNFFLLLASLVFFVTGCVLIGFMYHWFTPSDDCNTNATFLHITLICGLLYILLAIRLEHASILPASFVFMYTAILCYGAIQSGSTSGECNLLWSEKASTGLNGQVLISSAFAVFSLMYACVSASGSASAFQVVPMDEGEEAETAAGQFTFFHFIMALGSMYMAMILTNWSINAGTDTSASSYDHSTASMWVKIIAQWITIVTYTWTLFAPIALRDRDFD